MCDIRLYDPETRERLLYFKSNFINKSVNNDRRTDAIIQIVETFNVYEQYKREKFSSHKKRNDSNSYD